MASFMARATVSSVHEVLLYKNIVSHWPRSQAFRTLENNIRVEATACVRKYLMEASVTQG